jgi:integrase
MKNLVKVETRQKQAAGATKLPKADIKGKLVEYSWYMKKNGYPESTIIARTSIIKMLMNRRAPLHDPEGIKGFIAKQENWSLGYKANVVYAYTTFLEMEGLTWKPPRYKRPESFPFVPLEAELDKLIAAASKTVGTFLQGLKETGADPGELMRVKWIDINKQARSITINRPVKGHSPRILPISTELMRRLEMLPKKSERIFTCLLHSMQGNYREQRRRIARQFANPRLEKIVFTTFRHWKATMEYHRTKDILYVKKILGHKRLQNTMVYIDLEKAIYGELRDDEFTVKVAMTLEEACELLEAGFEYVTDMDGHKLFRKRK